jgi:replicative superfamily II helicase
MSLSIEAFDVLSQHWALEAIGTRDLDHAAKLVNERLAQRAVGKQITFSFSETIEDEPLLERVALAYEMAAIEGLDALSRTSGADDGLRDQATAASFRAFEIRRLFTVPESTEGRLFHILQLSTLAYCGDRWSDLRRWYKENDESLNTPSVADVLWDQRLLYRLFNCWVRLFRKKGWDDLDRIREIIAGLREDQKTFEEGRFRNASQNDDRHVALRLIALYHWAKATEVLAAYMLQGQPQSVFTQLDKHFEAAIKAATASCDAQLEVILRWLHAASRTMVTSSLWWGTRAVNSRVSDFVRALTRREHQAMFELLPPQRAALLEEGLLDQAKTAIVVDMPTSGGKTLLAQFRILQALNQFDANGGWVAYVAPTRALSSQITRRLRRDFEPINIRVEQLTGAIEIDAFEEQLLNDEDRPFDILVATPEKLALVIRNKKVLRPLALVVMDEAHNLEAETRGLRIELLLATIKRDCTEANFLLLMPFVEEAGIVARWLAQDINAGKAISFSTTAWKPNERIIGLYRAVADDSQRAGWRLDYETLIGTEKAMDLKGTHRVGGCRPIDVPKSEVLSNRQQKGLGLQTAAMSTIMSARGNTSIAVAHNINTVWKMARKVANTLPVIDTLSDDIRLVQNYLRTEISPSYELATMLDHGVGVHHAGLSDEVRSLMEWLAELGHLRILCATSTIAQGINFPVSSIFLASRSLPKRGGSVEMAPREFWNLVGRAGRIDQDSVGVVGLAEGTDRKATIDFVRRNTGALVSRLVTLLDELSEQGNLHNLSSVLWQDQWEDFRCYVAHLWVEKKNLDAVLADSEQLLRQTYGYTTLRGDPLQREKAEALLNATKNYAREIAAMPPGVAELADSTGFSPEGVQKAFSGIKNLEEKLTTTDLKPESLFGQAGKMADLFGIMLKIPQLKQQLEDIGGEGFDNNHLSNITRDWVNGISLETIAKNYFSNDGDLSETETFNKACKAIYRAIVNNGTWGVSALSRLSGIDLDSLSESDRRQINILPAMIYHGVHSEDAVLMRMNSAPRSIAEGLGSVYQELNENDETRYSISKARSFLQNLNPGDWERARPSSAVLSGTDYKRVWRVLSGEEF